MALLDCLTAQPRDGFLCPVGVATVRLFVEVELVLLNCLGGLLSSFESQRSNDVYTGKTLVWTGMRFLRMGDCLRISDGFPGNDPVEVRNYG